MVSVVDLDPAPYNPRKIKPANLKALTEELRRFGLVEPLVANRRGGRLVLVSGHQRLRASREIGWAQVPCRVLEVSEADERALNLALNNPRLQGEWDDGLLASLLSTMPAIDADVSGFSETAVARLLSVAGGSADDDDVPAPPATPRTKVGEVVALGPHRLLCGDARLAASYAVLFGDAEPAACLWTDPPYGVMYVGKTERRMTIDGDDPRRVENLLSCVFGQCNGRLSPGAPLYVCSPAGEKELSFLRAFMSVPWTYRQGLVWRKDSMVLGHADYHYAHEQILYGVRPGANGRRGRGGVGWYGGNDQTSVFDVPRPKASREHPTMKPVALIETCLRNSTRRGDVVLDPFAGSGSTLIAAHRLGRRAFLMEIDPGYCDVIRDRYAAQAGSRAGAA